MNAVLIPVRSMTGAKNRLAADFDDAARTRLTLAMLADMVAAARAARSVGGVYVVSADADLLERARRIGAEPLVETDCLTAAAPALDAWNVRGGLNRGVFAAAQALEKRSVARLLTIPGDVPLVAAAEIDELFAAACSAPVVLVPSGTGTGTNGLLTSPPCAIAPRFEGESLAAHLRACEEGGLVHALLALPGFALDVDTIADLRVLAARGTPRESAVVATTLLESLRQARPELARRTYASGGIAD
jgi:2-phospho-L-lactate guanylyltransferase